MWPLSIWSRIVETFMAVLNPVGKLDQPGHGSNRDTFDLIDAAMPIVCRRSRGAYACTHLGQTFPEPLVACCGETRVRVSGRTQERQTQPTYEPRRCRAMPEKTLGEFIRDRRIELKTSLQASPRSWK